MEEKENTEGLKHEEKGALYRPVGGPAGQTASVPVVSEQRPPCRGLQPALLLFVLTFCLCVCSASQSTRFQGCT